MRKLSIRIAFFLLTLLFGVAISRLWTFEKQFLGELQPVHPKPCHGKSVGSSAISACFPGLSVQLADSGADVGSHFPAKGLSTGPERMVQWYEKHLRAMQEPPMSALSGEGREIYRFLWLRSFHHPVAVRVSEAGNQHYMIVKELSGAGGYEPGKIIFNNTRQLSQNEWLTFSRLLDSACFWGLPPEQGDGGPDGARWILEGVSEGRYHIVDRYSPETGNYRTVCLYLLKISGLGIDETSEDLY